MGQKIFFGQIKILVQKKNFCSKKFLCKKSLGQKKFGVEENFLSENV